MCLFVQWYLILLIIGLALTGCGAGSTVSDNAAYTSPPSASYPPNPTIIDDVANQEEFTEFKENSFIEVTTSPKSTFGLDVDTASYSVIRRDLERGNLPPIEAIRIEEMVNFFKYDYPEPQENEIFSVSTEIAVAPWHGEHYLISIGLKGKSIPLDNIPASNLVLLLDVSGSMDSSMQIVKSAMQMLTDQLREQDIVSLVTYSSSVTVQLEGVAGSDKQRIQNTIDELNAGGSTAGGPALQTAYEIAQNYKIIDGNNRIILITDGDFNVGPSSQTELIDMVEQNRDSGIYISVAGVGMGNIKDNKMEAIADHGNGNYAYIDTLSEAQRVFVEEFGSTLLTIAKDVKAQIHFNPTLVSQYRLIGYENRVLDNDDFDNDKKDAGDLGSGHTVTAFYEVIPNSSPIDTRDDTVEFGEHEWAKLELRYKQPEAEESQLISTSINSADPTIETPSENFIFAAAIAELGLLLLHSGHKADANYNHVIQQASSAKGSDEQGYRAEFIRLANIARTLTE